MDTSIRKHIDSLELYQIKNFKHNTAVFLKHSKAVKNAGLTQYYKEVISYCDTRIKDLRWLDRETQLKGMPIATLKAIIKQNRRVVDLNRIDRVTLRYMILEDEFGRKQSDRMYYLLNTFSNDEVIEALISGDVTRATFRYHDELNFIETNGETWVFGCEIDGECHIEFSNKSPGAMVAHLETYIKGAKWSIDPES